MNSTLYLRRVNAAIYIKEKWGVPCAARTLAKLACIGGGPAFHKFGRIPVYTTPDLDAWAQGRITGPRRSTSDVGGA